MKKFTRREFVIGMSIGGIGLTSGCCCTAPRIEADSAKTALMLSNIYKSTKGGSIPMIDAHAHFFNATDIQAGGYLAGPVANEWGIAGPLMEIVSNIIDNIAKSFAPSTYVEWQYLNNLELEFKNIDSDSALKMLDKQIDSANKEIAAFLFTELSETDFPLVYNKLISDTGLKSVADFNFSEDTIYQSISNDMVDVKSLDDSAAKKLNFDLRSITAIFGFLGYMLSFRFYNIRKYYKSYAGGENGSNIIAAADTLVDFDYWVGDCDNAYSSMQDQIFLHQRLAKITDDYVFPVVAFNPWTAIKDKRQYMEMIEDAIQNRGFKGVKIYPPIGYYPMGNSEPGVYPVDNNRRPDLKKLDDALNDLYDICISNSVPVMAHGNHSMGRNNKHKLMAGPEGWKKVFSREELPKLTNLKVNIGHFGGNHKLDDLGNTWSTEFIELMKRYPNLYGDIGNWPGLARGKGVPEFIDLLNKRISGNRKAYERIMFGTDWFMLSLNPDWKSYPKNIYDNLKGEGVEEVVLKKFFSGNAKELFNL